MARQRISVVNNNGRLAPVELRVGKDMLGCGVLHICAKVTTATPKPKKQYCNRRRFDIPKAVVPAAFA